LIGVQVCGGSEACGGWGDVVSVLVQEGADFGDRAGDGASVHGEDLAEEFLGAVFAQVEQGGQDSLGWGELVLGSGAAGSASFGGALCFTGLVAALGEGGGEFVDEGAQLL